MTPPALLSIYYRLRVVTIIKIYDPRCRARAIKCTIRIVPWDAIKRVPIYMDARVLHVTVRPWGEKNGERERGRTGYVLSTLLPLRLARFCRTFSEKSRPRSQPLSYMTFTQGDQM